MRRALLFVLLLLAGCIRPPTHPHLALREAPPTPQQISHCESVRTAHNWWIVLGSVFGAGSGLSGVATIAASDQGVQLGVGIATAATGALGTLFTALAGVTADTYSTDNCQTILQEAASK